MPMQGHVSQLPHPPPPFLCLFFWLRVFFFISLAHISLFFLLWLISVELHKQQLRYIAR